ncbi:LEAF RUST 10 DISEASE-RESISTANCE LOCUS RECEPTOR-LIKE PROTEIN KINASE-like 1.2 isoform X2 [Phragmites australis]|uniref:LEAF RUST 10 DISEASE-RESISTANCE LOCUS RECEPTOR-LIKE PROTEIN KINASE-like 1.2 isoform X2 n=1 Tax=Phragmites australis TaxID=29695 RepID=UPI002D795886|nr:LEAF RUST 10 DISEASE-RESISTANCE LOCUS RECEPTOR-LIKE PROTEIN KINASE-like 1.2 isoform X2 [Phragmites australis]
MHPTLLLFPVLASLLLQFHHRAHADCEPATCGKLPVRYPFWLGGGNQSSSSCGHPAFQVWCDDGSVASLRGSAIHVLGIDYANNSFIASHTRVSAVNGVCRTDFNMSSSIALSPFTISRRNRALCFLYNCSGTEPRGRGYVEVTFNCGTPIFAYLGGSYYWDSPPAIATGRCTYTYMPVLGAEAEAAVMTAANYTRLLKDGFVLEWEEATIGDCAACIATGGECRYNNDAAAFACLCPDGRLRTGAGSTCAGKKSHTLMIGIVCGAGAGVILVVCFIFFVWHKRKRRKEARASNDLMRSGSSMQSYSKDLELVGSPHIFTYEELEEATDGFSASRELGDGGFGTVYKGKLRDGRVVAVKRLYKNNYKRVEQFLNEVDILSRLLHQNLVILYGCTSRSSRDLLLVYEFIPNGTVADHLHGPRATERGLTWSVRMNIAIETAEALAYLHAVEIIHRDVKTNNILLDNSFHVKVADFGLSRLFPLEVTHVSTVPQGTPGYVDPVYHQCYKLTDKSDVYSFGVVLVELISSKPAVDMSRSHSEINLANMALNRIQNHEVEQLVDPELGYEIDSETKRMIDLVAELAFQCLQLERDLRPSIKEVVDILSCIRNGECPAKRMDRNSSPKEDAHLLKNSLRYSPDSVIHRFHSQSTNHSVASNASG